MAKQWFNEAEYYLVKNWADALLLEESMNATRTKHAQILGKVADRVAGKHPDMTLRGIHVTAKDDSGSIGIGKNTWSCKSPAWPSGLWLWNLRLEDLVSSEGDPPFAGVSLMPSKDTRLDLKKAEGILRDAASQILSTEQRRDVAASAEASAVELWYPLPETRDRLLTLLLGEGASGFIDCLVAHFETLMNFTPSIDEVFQIGNRRRK